MDSVMLLFSSVSTPTICVLHYRDPLKVVIYESDYTLAVHNKLIYPIPSLMTHTTRTKASVIIPSDNNVLEIAVLLLL